MTVSQTATSPLVTPLRRLGLGQNWRELFALFGMPLALIGQHMLTNGLNEWLGFALMAVASVAIALAVRGVPLELSLIHI